jgi:hypothetical protein
MIQDLSVTKPAGFKHFTAVEVASYRGTPLVNVQAARERLLRSSAVTVTATAH